MKKSTNKITPTEGQLKRIVREAVEGAFQTMSNMGNEDEYSMDNKKQPYKLASGEAEVAGIAVGFYRKNGEYTFIPELIAAKDTLDGPFTLKEAWKLMMGAVKGKDNDLTQLTWDLFYEISDKNKERIGYVGYQAYGPDERVLRLPGSNKLAELFGRIEVVCEGFF